MTQSELSKIHIGHTDIVMRPDDIIQINTTDHTYTVEDINSVNRAVGILTNDQRTLVLIIASNFSDVDTDARRYLSDPKAAIFSIAEAYLISSLAQRIIVNFFIKVSGTPVPTRFFTEIEPALNWLKSFEKNDKGRKTESSVHPAL